MSLSRATVCLSWAEEGMWALDLFVENLVLVSRFVAEMMADDEGVLGLVAGGW